MNEEIKKLVGKTIESIQFPDSLIIKVDKDYSPKMGDDNIVIAFTDGSILKLASWDYEGYSSGIYKEVINSN